MSARALEFVEIWVSEKIEATEKLPADGDDATAKAWASQCFRDALEQDIPASEIQDAFDDLAAFISGEIAEARDREEEPPDEDEDDADQDASDDGKSDGQ
jgi:hypothetical protein